jgi:chemotaxis protein MotB
LTLKNSALIMLPQQNVPLEAVETGESDYMTSASDLMIGILFIFIVIVMVLLIRPPPANEPISQPPAAPVDPLADMVRIIGDELKNAGIPVTIDPTSGVISLPSDMLFSVGRSDLAPEGIHALQVIAVKLKQILPCYVHSQRENLSTDCPVNPMRVDIETLLIEGHTDARPLQRGEYTNWHLGLDRAHTVYKILGQHGVQTFQNVRLQPILGISSYADERPQDRDDAEKNRRVELRFVLAFQPNSSNAPQQNSLSLLKKFQTIAQPKPADTEPH